VTTFFEPIDVSATHIYHSALELSPLSSIVRRLYYHQRHPPLPRVVAGTLGSWDNSISICKTGGTGIEPSVWSPCGGLVATSYWGGVEIRDPLTSELFSTLLSTNPILALAYSPDGRALAALSGTSLIIWDIQTGGAVREVECGDTSNARLMWSLDGQAIGTILPGSSVVQVYDVDLGTMQSLGTLRPSGRQYLSRTQVTTADVTRLVKEIRDIKDDREINDIKGPLNKLKMLSKHLNNTPDLDPGRHEEGGRDDAGTDYNRLCPSLPTDTPDTQTHRDEAQTPGPSTPSQRPPVPSPA